MLQAVCFDFDGVIVDSEPLHFAGFRDVLAAMDIALSREAYYEHYLGYDDHDCFATVLQAHGRQVDEALIARLTEAKTQRMQRLYDQAIEPIAGAVELVKALRQRQVPLAICSGALRAEILQAARAVGVGDCFDFIVAAEDVAEGKPHPEGYRKAVAALESHAGRRIDAARCVVVEDSPFGIEAGKAAGCRVLAVMTSYDRPHLTEADRIVESLTDVGPDDLAALVG